MPDKFSLEHETHLQRLHNTGLLNPGFHARSICIALDLCRMLISGGLKVNSILDVGCRYGHAMCTYMAVFQNARVQGLDIVPEAAFFSRAICGDMCDMPFEDDEFDLVACVHSLEHAHDFHTAITEITRVAKRYFYVVMPLNDLEARSHHANFQSGSEFEDKVESYGWESIACAASHGEFRGLFRKTTIGDHDV
jgi:SAM-dependent methyltransferase